ncbi:MAG: group II intron reverse transcriptase/maturase [Candidatus Omnitrophica bacterium]|nr:group II intron reverse transcriptase/maturase [Candidatus Omnitrophota bacterium]
MDVSTIQGQIAAMAKRYPDRGLTSLNKYLDEDWLRAAFKRLRKDGATGVDGVSAQEYGEELDERLTDLVNRAKSGSYHAPAVRRTYIEKPGKREKRPLGIPTTEDKLLQKAVVMLLEPIYENEFYDFSYGFRPGRSCHQALQDIWKSVMDKRVGWILEADIRHFFDALPHLHLREIVRQRVRDGVITRLIDKWLKAGVLEAGKWTRTKEGTPQGGVISPLLSNVFLHEVLDKWFAEQVKPRLKGRCFMIRFADDFIMGFEHKRDAERVMEVLWKRFDRFGLELHPEKTRIVPFRRPGKDEDRKDKGSSQSFDFLGFTHYWGKSRKGNWVVKKKTAKDRLCRSLKVINQWCRENRHWKVKDQQVVLRQKMLGHYAYFGVTGNSRSLQKYAEMVHFYWHKWLRRRHRWNNQWDWQWYKRTIATNYPLPRPRIVHSVYSHAKPRL